MKCVYLGSECKNIVCSTDCIFNPKHYQNKKKPPLGITPKYVKNLERRQEILDAVSRYVEANMQIPIEWVEEYNELIKNIP